MRDRLRIMAEETLLILARGWYDHPEAGRVSIADDLARSVAGTRLWLPEESQAAVDEFAADRRQADRGPGPEPGRRPVSAAPARIEVTNETTLAAARRLVTDGRGTEAGGPIGCLNFASAKNPGGGFRGGAQAQEESLARSSGLYQCLLAAPGFYGFHRSQHDLRYSDRVIFSPAVPVFRDDHGALLAPPYPVSFVTAAAPNAGALGTGHAHAATLPEVLSARAAKVLAVLRASGLRQVVLGAWGCGVFRNPPETVAAAFAHHLLPGGLFDSAFDQVIFAVLDLAPGAPTISAFTTTLARP